MAARRVTDEQVTDELARCLAGRQGYPSPDEDAVRWLTKRINQYLAQPWTDVGIAELRERATSERREDNVLKEAARILSRDLTGWRQVAAKCEAGTAMLGAAEQEIAILETTIAKLRADRGYLTSPGLTVRLSERGPAPKPWTLMAAGIADEVHRVLRNGGDLREGLGGPDGPITNFLSWCLGLLLPTGQVPANSTISEAMKAHLSDSLKYRTG